MPDNRNPNTTRESMNIGIKHIVAPTVIPARSKRKLFTAALSLAIGILAQSAHGAAGDTPPLPDFIRVTPLLDVPMRQPSICRGVDGIYYLTGKVAADKDAANFQDNDGVYLWKSPDLKNWEAAGQVWSIEKDATKSAKGTWQTQRRPNPDTASAGVRTTVRGMISPKIHCIQSTFWITYSMNGWGCGLLKSVSGKAEGPYEDLGRITPEGASASLFADDDGTVYWIMDDGRIARLSPDMMSLAERPRLLSPKSNYPFSPNPASVGRRGAFMFKRDRKYYLVAADWSSRTGVPGDDSHVAASESVYGPFGSLHVMCPNAGETSVFCNGEGKWFCTMSGGDSAVGFRDRPAIVPLDFPANGLPIKPYHVIVERWPWEHARPIVPYTMRDLDFIAPPDGCVYFTGSVCDSGNIEPDATKP